MSRISAVVHKSSIPLSIGPAAVGLPTLVNLLELNVDEVFGTHRSTAKRQLFSGERDFGEPQVDFCKAPVATLGTYAVVSTDLPLHPGRYVPDGPRARAADDLHVRRAHRSRRGPQIVQHKGAAMAVPHCLARGRPRLRGHENGHQDQPLRTRRVTLRRHRA